MSFVDRYLPYFRQQLITCLPLALLLSSLCLLKVHVEISSLLLPTSPDALSATQSLCYVLVFSSLFIVQFFVLGFFCGAGGGSVCPGGYAGLS
jgi:hypothetical protein